MSQRISGVEIGQGGIQIRFFLLHGFGKQDHRVLLQSFHGRTRFKLVEVLFASVDRFIEQVIDKTVYITLEFLVNQREISRLGLCGNQAAVFFQHDLCNLLVYFRGIILIGETMVSHIQQTDLFLLLVAVFSLQGITDGLHLCRYFCKFNPTQDSLIQHPATETEVFPVGNYLFEGQ